MDQGLTIVPAGAGAGKTHRIKTQLSNWVKRGVVRPDRILAVTFTEAAASELRERIRSGLLADGLVTEAMAVERAYVSTIHGLGLRLLSEHALAAGASPQPRHLGDAERDLLIRQCLAHATALDPIKAEPARFGYQANWQSGDTIEDALRGRVLSMIDLLRGLGDNGRSPHITAPALTRLDALYGPVLSDASAAAAALHSCVRAMTTAFPNGGMETVTAKTPRERLDKEAQLFARVVRSPDLLDRDWTIWQSLRNLFLSNRSSKTPPGYDELATTIMSAADVLPSHPGPLEDAKLHLQCLVSCAQEVMTAYEARKKALGLIDFADMITGAEKLLRTNSLVRDAVLGEIDCVIIDEFQDTNPVQFALLWQLGSRAPRSLLVGDVKQSIMGFQGADPRLSQALAATNPDATEPLGSNWRSTPAMMEFINSMGAGLFGSGYNRLEPTRSAVDGPALEVLYASKGRNVQAFAKPQEHVAERIVQILNNGELVTDRTTQAERPAKPSDIALLVCRHSTAMRYAQELRARGVPVRIAEDGWAGSLIIQVARAALSFAANPSDTHAALVLRTLGPDPLDLQKAVSDLADGTLREDPVLVRLAELSDRLVGVPVSVALELVLEASAVYRWAASLVDGSQSRADLLRLQAEAEAFEAAHRDLKAASGFHGETAKVFLGWLDAQGGERDFDRRPDPSSIGADAVEIVTWHASKGREWPITVVAEFDNGIEERPGTSSTRFEALDNINDIAAVLESAQLIHTPTMVAPEAQTRFVEDRRGDFETNARNLLYVALTRARDRLILEWPGFMKDREDDAQLARALFHVFEDACRPRRKANSLAIGDVECAALITNLPEQAGFTAYVARQATGLPEMGRATPLPSISLTPWRLQPSQSSSLGYVPESHAVVLGEPWAKSTNDIDRGTVLHLALRTYLTRPDLGPALAEATGLSSEVLGLVSERAEAIRLWLEAKGYKQFECEVPFLGRTAGGAEIPGVIDLLATNAAGSILIDHKTGGAGTGLGGYWPQLAAYGRIVSQLMPNQPLQQVAIHWVDQGTLEVVDFAAVGLHPQTMGLK
ncbi:ATP-dependent exoDNAse (exonuclease V) beta subunit (contains helicase and exonuclease domains) [Devosia sp. YR412]|uniref:UvrD-helicase domain-containing protein n=1 Tax=Devosia sp. YR412 TaxID=1881030 RepID=UPI0008D63735|nr:UvrD-helicase domain-containing protein [Devosia sp. YR412]SEP82043.1 ATP-dependent exoDNAse (exonuclease V) beta subunit (contains helicase and exonuclease domains) [Devosia sp. YR412]